MITKKLNIGGKDVAFASSAAIPRVYRIKFKRDIFLDLQKLYDDIEERKGEDGPSTIPLEDLGLFENVAYAMAYHADPKNTPEDIDAWLDQFEMFSIYEVLPELLELWGDNMFTTSTAKKNDVALSVV